MAIYKIKRGLAANLQGATFEAYEPAYTTDTNELYVADANGQAVKVSDHIVVEALPAVEASVKGKFYVVAGAVSGTVYYFDGANHIPLSSDLSGVSDALATVSATLIGIQADIEKKADALHTHAISDINDLQEALDSKLEATDLTAVQELAQKANDNLAAHEADAEAKYATKAEIEGVATEEYVNGRVSDLIGAAPETLDTLGEIAAQLKEDSDATAVIRGMVETNQTAIATKADQTKLDAAEARIDVLEAKPETVETSVVVDGKEVKGAVNFAVTGNAAITINEASNTISIDVPVLLEIDGGNF